MLRQEPKSFLSSERVAVKKRDNNTCQYCDTLGDAAEMTADHVIPVCRGGSDDRHNLVCACPECNDRKGNMTLREWRNVLAEEVALQETSPSARLGRIIIVNIDTRFGPELKAPLPEIRRQIARGAQRRADIEFFSL